MRKFVKLTSVFLAVLILALAIPFSAVAKTLTVDTYTEDTTVISAEKLLLHLDNLADTTNNVEGSDVTVGEAKIQGTITASGDDLFATTNTRGWRGYNKETSLSLDAGSQYTITYTATLPKVEGTFLWTMIGFSFQGAGSDALTLWKSIHDSSPNTILLSKSNSSAQTLSNAIGNTVANSDDFSGEHNYMISIDGKNIAFYMDGNRLAVLGGDAVSYAADKNLSIGMRTHNDPDTTAEGTNIPAVLFYSMKNIKVYSGAYCKKTTAPSYSDGDTLLTLKTPLTLNEEYSYTSDYEDLTVSQFQSTNLFGKGSSSVTNSTGDDTAYVKATGYGAPSHWLEGGVVTNLPLNADSQYTIEFYAKNHLIDNVSVGFVFDFVARQKENQGILLRKDWVTTVLKNSAGEHSVVGSPDDSLINCKGVWTNYCADDGFTRFTLEIDGTQVTVYTGGKKLGAFEFDSYNGTSLSLALKCEVTEAPSLATEAPLLTVKDVTVYAGNIGTSCKVRFEKDGEAVGTVSKGQNEKLEAADFPTVDVAEGKLLKWFYKGTNIIVNAPYTVTHDITLEAREIDPKTIQVSGMQYTEASEGKQSVRFISSLHTLQASEAGFHVRAVYRDETGVHPHKTWDVKSTVVYSAIKATNANGTVTDVSANELGGTYLTALAVNGVPSTYEQIDFYVTAYIVVDGVEITSDEVRFTMSNGVSNQSLDALTVPEA